jgi:hypothetical protein
MPNFKIRPFLGPLLTLTSGAFVGLLFGWHLFAQEQQRDARNERTTTGDTPVESHSAIAPTPDRNQRNVRVILPGPVPAQSSNARLPRQPDTAAIAIEEDHASASSSPRPANPPRQVEQAESQYEPKPLCNVATCSRTFKSFRRSDCTYQPYSGPRRVCEDGRDPDRDPLSAHASARPESGSCNVQQCARTYRSFDPVTCTYRPYRSRRRERCDL